MAKTIIHYYWALSDWAYFGFPRLQELAQKHNAKLDHRPVDLPAIYAKSGGIVLAKRGVQRQEYRFCELERWRKKLGMPLNLNPKYFPQNVHLAAQLAYAAKRDGGDVARLSFAFLKAMWVDEQNIDDELTLRNIVTAEGFDTDALFKAAISDDIVEEYKKNTNLALEDGVFGSPFYIYEGHRFWGQDRLFMLDEVLAE